MADKKSKIEIASPEEVVRFAPGSPAQKSENESPGPAEAPTEEPGDDITSLRAQLAEAQDKFLRARAEAQNIAKRAQQAQLDAVRYGNADLLKALLPVVDDFERTLAAAGTDQVQPVIDGVKLVYEKLMKLMERRGGLIIFVLAAILNPFFYPAALAAGALRFGVKKYFIITLLGKAIKGMTVAYAGYWGLRGLLRMLGAPI